MKKKCWFCSLCTFTSVIVTLVVSSCAAAAEQNIPKSARQAGEQMTMSLVQLNVAYRKASDAQRPQVLGQMKKLASRRSQLLHSLLDETPSEVVRLAIPDAVSAGFPAPLQSLIEQPVEAEGTLQVAYEDGFARARLHYFLNTVSERLEVHFAIAPSTGVVTGSTVRIHGVRLGRDVAVSSGKDRGGMELLRPAQLAGTMGQFNTLVIMVNFQDNPTLQPFTAATVQNIVFTQTSNWDMENSFQQTWLTGDVAGWFTIPVLSTNCDTGSIKTDARSAAQTAGYNLANYTRFIYLMSSNTGCSSWWGYSIIGGSDVWVNGEYNISTHVFAHEMGHNLGMYHAHTVDCGTLVICSSGTYSEYGDWIDDMGASSFSNSAEFGAFHKEQLGWIGSGSQPPLLTVTSSGVYTLAPYESQDSGAKALKILQSSSTNSYYYVEYRQALGADTFLSAYSDIMSGVVMHLASPSNANSDDLLDMTPTSPSSFNHPALTAGNVYNDAAAGVSIQPLTVGTTATVQVTLSNSCAHANPTVTIAPSTGPWVAAGTPVNFTLTVTNNDSSYCTSSSFNLSDAVPSGWSAVLGAQSLTLAPGAHSSTNLQVTSPAGTANGYYNFTATASNASAPSYAATASATYVVSNVTLTMTVTTNSQSYTRGQTVTITSTVLANGQPQPGANVTVVITKSDHTTVTLTGTTGSAGTSVVTYRLRTHDPTGTYTVQSSASYNSQQAQASTSFTVH